LGPNWAKFGTGMVPTVPTFIKFGQNLIFGTKSGKIWYWNVFIKFYGWFRLVSGWWSGGFWVNCANQSITTCIITFFV